MKVIELFEAMEKKVKAPLSDQDKMDNKFMRYLGNELIRVTRSSMKEGLVKWWMKSPQKLVIESDRHSKIVLTDKILQDECAEFGFKSLEDVKAFFERYELPPSKKPPVTKIINSQIYD